jgi:hypothetical protein
MDLTKKMNRDVLMFKGQCLFDYGLWVEKEENEEDVLSGIMFFPQTNINNDDFESTEETERFCVILYHEFSPAKSYVGLKKQQVRDMFSLFKENDDGETSAYLYRLKDGMSFEEFCLIFKLLTNG